MIAGAAVFGLATLGVRHVLARRIAAEEGLSPHASLPALDPVREMA
jgi:hypothetical protein